MQIMKNSSKAKEKLLANEFCVRDLAIEHLKEKTKCAAKADRYVDYVFEKCKNDTAPMNSSKSNKLKNLTSIMWSVTFADIVQIINRSAKRVFIVWLVIKCVLIKRKKSKIMDLPGFEPGAFRMQSERDTTTLQTHGW